MDPFDELPQRDRNHEIEDEAIAAFQMRLTESGAFILQASDRKDYGTDCQIEVMADGQATNVRVHVQLKGTANALNADGSLSVELRRTNLNYLLMQPAACTSPITLRRVPYGSAPRKMSLANIRTAGRTGPISDHSPSLSSKR